MTIAITSWGRGKYRLPSLFTYYLLYFHKLFQPYNIVRLLSIFEHFRILWLERFDFSMRHYGCVAPSSTFFLYFIRICICFMQYSIYLHILHFKRVVNDSSMISWIYYSSLFVLIHSCRTLTHSRWNIQGEGVGRTIGKKGRAWR